MDQVEQDRATAGLPTPTAADLEVVVGLVEQRRPVDRDDRPEHSAVHDLPGLGHDRGVVAVVAGQHRHPGRLPRLDQPGRALDGVPDRLLHDHRHPGRDALQPAVDVQLIGCGQDDPVRLVGGKQLGQRRVTAGHRTSRASSGPAGPGRRSQPGRSTRSASISSMCRWPISPAPATAIRTAAQRRSPASLTTAQPGRSPALGRLAPRRAGAGPGWPAVAVHTEADDDPAGDRRDERVVPELLPRVHVRDVALDHRQARALDRVVHRHRGVRVAHPGCTPRRWTPPP